MVVCCTSSRATISASPGLYDDDGYFGYSPYEEEISEGFTEPVAMPVYGLNRQGFLRAATAGNGYRKKRSNKRTKNFR